MDQMQIAFFLIILGAILQGTFGIFIKDTKPLKWENFWAIFSVVAYLLGPLIFALFQIQNLSFILNSIPRDIVYLPLIFGMIWGIGAILFGICVVKIGVSLTYSIILGIVTLTGAILPIFINKISLNLESGTYLSVCLVIVTTGIILSGYAGVLRDRFLKIGNRASLSGIMLAVISGIFSSFLNLGFVTGKDINAFAIASGVSDTNSSALVWLIVIFGGFIVNFTYALYLLSKNKSFYVYKKINIKVLLPVLTSGVFWFTSFALFGIGSTKMGTLGPSVGWAILLSLSIVVSNTLGIKFGEWKSTKKALRIQLVALGLIILGVILVSYSALTSS